MKNITIPQHDHGFNLSISLQDYSGDIKNISGYTVGFRMWEGGVPTTVIHSTACTTVVASGGTITVPFLSGAIMSSEVRYMGEICITMSGVHESFEAFGIKTSESPR